MTREDIDKCAEECADNNMVVPIDCPFYDDDYEEYKEAYVKTFKAGVEYADSHPKSPWISVKDDLPCNHKELIHSNYTDRVLMLSRYGYADVTFMSMIEDVWEWETPIKVLYWMPIPEFPKE